MRELTDLLSTGELIISDLTESDVRAMLKYKERTELARKVKRGLDGKDFEQGAVFGTYPTLTETKPLHRAVAAFVKSSGWYVAYGEKKNGKYRTPYKIDDIQVKDLNLEQHPEFANSDPEHYVVRVLRLPKPEK